MLRLCLLCPDFFYFFVLLGVGLVGNGSLDAVCCIQVASQIRSARLGVESLRARVGFPSVRVGKLDLLFACLCSAFGVEEGHGTWSSALVRTDTAEVEVDGSIQSLHTVLDEQRDLDVLVSEELEDLLLDDEVIKGLVVLALGLESSDAVLNKVLHRRPRNQISHRQQMLHRHVVDLLRLASRLHLVLKSHQHEVKQLLHTRRVQLHDGTVGELLKDLLGAGHGVHGLSSEELLHKLGGEHTFNDVLQNLLRSFLSDVLRPQSLV